MNVIILIGAVKGEVKTGSTQNGKDFARINLEVARDSKPDGSPGGKDFFNVKCWGKAAGRAGELQEGVRIALNGKMQNERYQDQEGGWRDSWTVTAFEFELLAGTCPATADAPGSVMIDLPALGYAVCYAR